jgi:hypothetical protein
VFDKLAEGHAPMINNEINGYIYNKGYYLADGTYAPWETFVKTISTPFTEKMAWYSQCHEACMMDFERIFGVPQALFSIVRYLVVT